MRFLATIMLVWFGLVLRGQPLQQKVDRFAGDYALRHANLSICILDIEEHVVVADHRSERVAVPASALKLLTTATALSVLGPNYRFLTEVQYDGTFSASRINGNVWIKGYGDPSLGSSSNEDTPDWDVLMKDWAQKLKEKGIKTITGSVLGDGSYFDSYGAVGSWPWADIGNYYGSDARGLNFNENKYTLYFSRTSKVGEQPRIARLEPDIPWMEYVNELRQAGPHTGDQAYIYGGPYTYLKYIRGSIPAGSGLFDIDGAIPDPPLVAARTFRLALEEIGIEVLQGEGTLGSDPLMSNRKGLIRHQSPELSELVERTNRQSVNLYAEAMVKVLGKKMGEVGSTAEGIKAILSYWSERGVSTEGMRLYDGSGLSPKNAVSARFLTEVLRKVSLNKDVFPTFLSSIPKAGRTGTLRGKFKGSAAENNLYAKSGTLGNVRGYAGYFTGADGRFYAFAVLVNNYTTSGGGMRLKLDQLLQSFCE